MYLAAASQPYRLKPFSRADKAILFIDIVESVRLYNHDEERVFERWHRLLEEISTRLVQRGIGELIEVQGDGAIFAFDRPQDALTAAIDIDSVSAAANAEGPPDLQIALRMGLEFADVIASGGRYFGRGVNMASRLADLAQPGEVVLSEEARARLGADHFVTLEELGDCYVKHCDVPIRSFRLKLRGAKRSQLSRRYVVPQGRLGVPRFRSVDGSVAVSAVVDQVWSQATEAMRTSPNLTVDGGFAAAEPHAVAKVLELATAQGLDYLIVGGYLLRDQDIAVHFDLLDVRGGGRVGWHRINSRLDQLDGGLGADIATAVERRIFSAELRRCRVAPAETQSSTTLLIAARGLMNHMSLDAFNTAGHLLNTLVGRATRQPVPQAWLAYWHVIRILQGWSSNPARDRALAHACIRTAVDTDPDCSLGLAIDGLVHTHLEGRLDEAEKRFDAALRADPSNGWAWLMRGMLHGFTDRGDEAVRDVERGLVLQPHDRSSYYFTSLAASAYFTAGRYDQAVNLSQRSLANNNTHVSTWRVWTAAQARLGDLRKARRGAARIMELQPDFRVERHRAKSPSAAFGVSQRLAHSLQEAGLPL